MTQRAANGEVLIPTQQLVEGHHDRSPPARVRGVHATVLGCGTLVLKNEGVATLVQYDLDPVHIAITRPATFNVSPITPGAIGQLGHFVQKGVLAVVQNFPHHGLHHISAVALEQRLDPFFGRQVARQLGTKIQCDGIGFSRGPKVQVFDIFSDFAFLNNLHGRDQNPLFKGTLR